MKLLYTGSLLMAILQLSCPTTLANYSFTIDASSFKKELSQFYRAEFNLIAGEICVILKNISEEILKDEMVESSSTVLMKEFKENITNFNFMYQFYLRFGLNESLAITFSNLVSDFYGQQLNPLKDMVTIQQLLTIHGYTQLRDKYKIVLKQFYYEKFVPKYEQLRSRITNKSELEKFENKFEKCVLQLNECQDYECYLKHFRKTTFKLKDQLMGNLQREFMFTMFKYLRGITEYINDVAKDDRMQNFSTDLRNNLKKSVDYVNGGFKRIKNFRGIFLSNQNDEIDWFLMAQKYLLSAIDYRTLEGIFKEYRPRYPTADYVVMFERFVNYGLIKEVKHFRSSFSQTELQKENLWNVIKDLNYSSSRGDKADALTSLNIFNYDYELKKWRI